MGRYEGYRSFGRAAPRDGQSVWSLTAGRRPDDEDEDEDEHRERRSLFSDLTRCRRGCVSQVSQRPTTVR